MIILTDLCPQVLPDLTVEAVNDFIPRLLASLHVECLVYGDSTPARAADLYRGVVNKLTSDCCSRPLLPSQLIKEREVELRDAASVYTTTNGVHRYAWREKENNT